MRPVLNGQPKTDTNQNNNPHFLFVVTWSFFSLCSFGATIVSQAYTIMQQNRYSSDKRTCNKYNQVQLTDKETAVVYFNQ